MLKPEYFEGKSDIAVSYYQELEDYLLKTIADFLIKSEAIGGKADRMVFVLQQMGMTKTDITKRLARLSALSQKEIRRILKNSVMTSFSSDKEVLKKVAKGEIMPLKNPAIVEVLEAEWRKTNGELENLTRTTMSQMQSDVVTLLNEVEIRTASGNMSYSEAINEVLDDYAKVGMLIEYPFSGARRTLESAVRCAIVTSINQTAAEVTNAYIREGEIDYVIVSAHTGARVSVKNPHGVESHAFWQGKIYKIHGSDDKYDNLYEATGYNIDNTALSNPLGLHGYNCRHSHGPAYYGMPNSWIDSDGVSIVDDREETLRKKRIDNINNSDMFTDEEKTDLIRNMPTTFKLSQKQRGIERSIRSYKRRIVAKEEIIKNTSAGAERNALQQQLDTLNKKLKSKKKYYNQFCKLYDLRTQRERLRIAGSDK